MKINTIALLLFFVIGSLSVQHVAAAGCHYEFDKDYYHPGDNGYFLAELSNNRPEYIEVAQATLNITGIGVFAWDPLTVTESDLHSASLADVYVQTPDGNWEIVTGCHIEMNGSAVFRVYFTIPENAEKGSYMYNFYMPIITDAAVNISGGISVYPPGEVPPPDVVGIALSYLFLVGLLLFLVFTPVFFILKWRKKKVAAKCAKVVLILSAIFICVALYKIIIFAMYIGFVFFPFWPLLVLVVLVVLLWWRFHRHHHRH